MRKYSKYPRKHNQIALFWVRILFSITLFVLAALHIFSPSIRFDYISLIIITIAMLPWLALLIRALELPGGWKVEFKDFEIATKEAEAAGLLAEESITDDGVYSFQLAAMHDPILALAGLRIEIEKRLSQLVIKHTQNKQHQMGVGQALRVLEKIEVLQPNERSILADMTSLLNNAVHGAEVDPRAATWAIEVGPRLLKSLDERISGVNNGRSR
jgi:hypothetical protein